jgi:integrase
MSSQRRGAAVSLPRGVHAVIARGRQYFYFQAGRGTPNVGERIRLPSDPHSPEFWQAIRQAQGLEQTPTKDTIGGLIDAYLASPQLASIEASSQRKYRTYLGVVAAAWGSLPSVSLMPHHVQALMDKLSGTPGRANNVLAVLSALSAYARPRNLLTQNITEGIKSFKTGGGHKPWTPAQVKAAHDKLTGNVRRGIMLYLYTGQRGSDIVRIGWTDMDEGGFSVIQRKTKREVWCPIVPELAAEIATWEKRPGPFLLQASGRPYTRKRFWQHFDKARGDIPELADVTLHGLRCTAVIRLRRAGLSVGQIGDIVGMSLATIERYCRFADRKTSGQAALVQLTAGKPRKRGEL